MKTRIILMLFTVLFTFAGVSSKADVVKKVKTGNSKVISVPGRHKARARVYQQGPHRWHRMHRRHAHERVRRHHMRHMHHKQVRHYRHR